MKSLYTTIDPIPSHIPRQLAIELLHSHGELITLNPLVLDYTPIKAPRDAPNDEYYATWYEITQKIQFVPGMGKLGSSNVSFRGCFHDVPGGVQTHMYVPFGVDLRHKYQIKGNQPGEPPEQRELGSDAPSEGLYLRVDVQIKCNMAMLSFVKKELKAASKTMIERMIKKAELIDSGVLRAMFNEQGKLTTINPNDKSGGPQAAQSPYGLTPSPFGPTGTYSSSGQASPSGTYMPSPSLRPESAYARQSGYNGSPNMQQTGNGLAIEMPAGYPDARRSSHGSGSFQQLGPGQSRFSTCSELSSQSPIVGSSNGRHSDLQSNDGSDYSRPTTYSQGQNYQAPRYEAKSFVAELPSNEAVTDHAQAQSLPQAYQPQQITSYQPQQMTPNQSQPTSLPPFRQYNPQDYASPQQQR